MDRFVKGGLMILLGILMLGWFLYSIIDPPTRPSETYMTDWMLVGVKLVGGIAGIISGVLAFRK